MLEQRKEFVRKLVNYLRDGSHIVYLDETTTFIHNLPKHTTWQPDKGKGEDSDSFKPADDSDDFKEIMQDSDKEMKKEVNSN